MRLNLSARDRRALRVAGLVVTAVLGVHLVVRPYLRTRAEWGGAIRAERALLQREAELVAHSPDIVASLAKATAIRDNRGARLFPRSDQMVVQGDFVAEVEGVAKRVGIPLRQLSIDAVEPQGHGIRALELICVVETDFRRLAAFLELLHEGPRLYRIPGIEIAPIATSPGVVRATLRVRGFGLAGSSAEGT